LFLAAFAMNGLIQSRTQLNPSEIAELAFEIANEMLEEPNEGIVAIPRRRRYRKW
jgi:sensor histidine kinase regulating citrate/malate metabolism